MKFDSKIYRIGDKGVSIYIPAPVRDEFDLEEGDECTIRIIEDKKEGDKENVIVVKFD